MLLSTALFSTVFMQLFGGDFVGFIEPNDEKLRFDTFWQSFISLIMVTVFHLLIFFLTYIMIVIKKKKLIIYLFIVTF